MAASFSSSDLSCSSLPSSSSYYSITPPRSPGIPPLNDDVDALWASAVESSDPDLSDHTLESEDAPNAMVLLGEPLASDDEDDYSWDGKGTSALDDEEGSEDADSSDEEEVTSIICWGDTTSDDDDDDDGGRDPLSSSPSSDSSDGSFGSPADGSPEDEDFPPAKRQRRE